MKFNGYQIRKSGKNFFKIIDNQGNLYSHRVTSVEAAQALILSKGRCMTRKEHSLVHGSNPNHQPTKEQSKSEMLVKLGLAKGII